MNSNIFTALKSFDLEKGLTPEGILEELSSNEEMQFRFKYQGNKYYGHLKLFEDNASWCFFNIVSEE